MTRRIHRWTTAAATAMAAMAVLASGPSAAPVAGTTPQRIVCFIPAVTQMLCAIGAGPQVVAVDTYDHEPPAVTALPRVGGLLDPDTERILAMRPDLVIVYDGQSALEERLARAGVPMFKYRHGDLANVMATMRALGRAVGRAAEAETLASGLERRLAAIVARVAGRARPLTLLVLGREPNSLQNIYASGGYGFLHDMLVTAGARDMLDDVKRESVEVSTELVLARRPDVIVELQYGDGAGPSTGDDLSPWRALSAVPAVKSGRLYRLVGDEFVEAGPRLGDATEKLSRVLQPEAWR